ncbi:hypothetical protein [Dokdonia sp. Asnod1-B02]|uniref:hypothetical protein n=1 Tax=Dokdonia sp. Asnod1-B02 TaxID=3160573 RepID=UPI003870C278
MEIKIGADELILWLRKNKKAENVTTKQLGLKILNSIEDLGGKLIEHDKPCSWNTKAISETIDEFNLPKTASQYILDSRKLDDLYCKLSSW